MSANTEDRSNVTSTSSQEERDGESLINSANVALSYNNDANNTVTTTINELPIMKESPQSSQASTSAQISTYSPESLPGSSVASGSSQIPDYCTRFTRITSLKQRMQYTLLYYWYFEEYKKLNNKMAIAAKNFLQLNEQSHHQSELGDLSEGEKLRQRILKSVDMLRGLAVYQEMRNRCIYLHNLLIHILLLLNEYDKRCCDTMMAMIDRN